MWSWFSHRVFYHFDFYQFALKIWKSFSWMIQKKHDLIIQLFVVFNIENLISYNSRFSIWWLTINWMTMKFEFESIYIFYFSISNIELMNCSKKKLIKREKRRNHDRIEYQISKFVLFFVFVSFHIHIHNIQRSIKSNNNFWKCFWHDSVFHAS